MKKQIVLINRKGKEAARLPMPKNSAPVSNPYGPVSSGWIYFESKWYGFGVGKLNGESHYYEVAT